MTSNTDNRETAAETTDRDISGFRIFSAGDLGAAHAMSHQMLDLGCYQLGHRRLQAWLSGRTGQGSKWVHVQWHMLVFELAVGERDSALERLCEHILPAAASTREALTDAPAAMWRIALASPEPVELPWPVVWAAAVDELDSTDDPYVTLHNLLALAGAGDIATLDRWLTSHPRHSRRDQILHRMAVGLRCFASGDYDLATSSLEQALPHLSELGGSRAQNQLFVDLYRTAMSRCADTDTTGSESDRLAAN